MASTIIMYSKKICPFCKKAKILLNNKGITEIEEIDIENNDSLREEMIKKTGRKTVPQIFINNHHIGGFDDLNELNNNGKLDKLL